MLTLTAVLVCLSFLKEWERLSNTRSSKSTWATFDLRYTVGILAHQLAFWFRAVWFMTFPVTFGFFTNWFALRFGCLAVSHAMRLFADCDALRAVKHFTSFIWAFDLALRFFTFHIANCVFGFGT